MGRSRPRPPWWKECGRAGLAARATCGYLPRWQRRAHLLSKMSGKVRGAAAAEIIDAFPIRYSPFGVRAVRLGLAKSGALAELISQTGGLRSPHRSDRASNGAMYELARTESLVGPIWVVRP